MTPYTKHHQVGLYLTGGASNLLSRASLGGLVSSYEHWELGAHLVRPIPGLKILNIQSNNGIGQGTLAVDGDGYLTWTPPGDTIGAAVAIAVGQTRLIAGSNTTKTILVSRVASDRSFLGTSLLSLVRNLNGLFSMGNLTDAERQAGKVTYRCLIVKNQGTRPVVTIQLWIPPAGIQSTYAMGTEVVVDGAVQSIANEGTAPTAISFQNVPNQTNALFISRLGAGDMMGVWIRRTFPPTGEATVRELVSLEFNFKGE